ACARPAARAASSDRALARTRATTGFRRDGGRAVNTASAPQLDDGGPLAGFDASLRYRPAAVMSAFRAVLPGFLATRIALFALAAFAGVRLPIDAREAQGFHLSPQPHAILEAWARYDACWFAAIAERGYRQSIGPTPDMRAAFFPLFPALMATLTPIVGTPLLAGLIVSNTCLLIFLALLWTIVQRDWGPEVARRATWIYLLFPSGFFLSGAYSESLLLVTTTAAVLMARRRHWLLAGILAGLATLARPIGVIAV